MESSSLMEFKPRILDRFPRLETDLMVEKALFQYRSNKTITEIGKPLPKKVMWTTFITILDYLEYSGKIHVEPNKTITWLWDPEGIERLRRKGLIVE